MKKTIFSKNYTQYCCFCPQAQENTKPTCWREPTTQFSPH